MQYIVGRRNSSGHEQLANPNSCTPRTDQDLDNVQLDIVSAVMRYCAGSVSDIYRVQIRSRKHALDHADCTALTG